jgi:hypothetical protein
MEPLHDWRSPQFEEQLGRLDRGGVTFEFLRRNKSYRRDYRQTLTEIAAGGLTRDEAIQRLSRRWGLSFPGRSFCIGAFGSPPLGPCPLPCNARCRDCPGGLFCLFAA